MEVVSVIVDVALQKDAKIPFPIEEEYVILVEDAVGHIVGWPSHLVIKCAALVMLFT